MTTPRALRQVPRDREPGQRPPRLAPGQISINEIYASIQGECGWMGAPTTFVRTSHCPLRCVWCDSKYTFQEGATWSTEDVVTKVEALRPRHVCLTGGEPLAQPESFLLSRSLVGRGFTVEVETSGSEPISPFNQWPADARRALTVNLDVKCPGSAMTAFNRWENLRDLQPHDQLKFVLAGRADFDYATDVLTRHRPACPAWLNPVWGVLDAAAIAGWVGESGLDARVGIQLHKYLWGEKRGV